MIELRRVLAVLLVILFGVGLTACGSDSDSGDDSPAGTTSETTSGTGDAADPDGVEGGVWTLMNIGSVDGWATSIPSDAEPPTLTIEDGRAMVFAGCNSGGGSAEVGEQTIVFGPIGLTKMACEQVNEQIEHLVTQVIDRKVEYEINAEGNLVLTRKGNKLVYTRE